MTKSIFPTYGVAITVIKGGSPGIKLDGISDVLEKAQVPAFITEVVFEDTDVVLPVVALDDKRVLYSFGKNFGKASISGIIYIFGCNLGTMVPGLLYEAFNGKRSSKESSPTTLSIVGGLSGIKVYPTSISFSQPDAKFQYITFTVSGIVAPVANK